MKNWTAPSVFSFEFFRELYSDSTAQDQCQFFPYQTEFRSLWEVFQMSIERSRLTDGTDPWYIGCKHNRF
ncbi:unnamed protein product [Nesidiocoris tenuis]|uniref:Uncharacterized protein n=1 Tax=Nesidiocoris tenuis TaxID=355587 RepID=A0A6H5GDQ4_9HEMI|nr:unnamed protein product [Nesidiocoris tenuis]